MNEEYVYTVDLQSLLLCPKSNASALYYRRTAKSPEIIREEVSREFTTWLKPRNLHIKIIPEELDR